MKRLDCSDWLRFALDELSDKGYPALKAQRLARGLGVTRGSFYWHFDSLDAFNAALIEHWSAETTDRLIATVRGANAPRGQLETLMKLALRSGAKLERAVRAWATVDGRVAALVDKVDARRIEVARDLLAALGVSPDDCPARAQLLYWAAIGRLMTPYPEESTLTDAEIERLVALFATA